MHAWPALHCLTVVFSRCHRLTAPCRGDGIMCSGAGAEWRREQRRGAPPPAAPLPPPQTPHCEKSVGRALRARRIRRRAKCRGQAERHGVLGPGSFFPISQRLCLIMRAEGRKKSRITPMSPKVGVNRAEMSFAVVFWCSWRRSRGRNVVTNEVSGKGSFPFSGGKKKRRRRSAIFTAGST